MTSPRILLKVSNLRPKKSLGQNFLLNQTLAETIVDRAGIKENDHVLEIGCGLGAITIPAAKKAARLVAVEKDAQLLDLLRTELAVQQLSNVELVHQDILTLNFADYFGPETPSATSVLRFSNTPRGKGVRSCANSSDTGSGMNFMNPPKCPISVAKATDPPWCPAWCLRLSR